jgi:hypothetical protein
MHSWFYPTKTETSSSVVTRWMINNCICHNLDRSSVNFPTQTPHAFWEERLYAHNNIVCIWILWRIFFAPWGPARAFNRILPCVHVLIVVSWIRNPDYHPQLCVLRQHLVSTRVILLFRWNDSRCTILHHTRTHGSMRSSRELKTTVFHAVFRGHRSIILVIFLTREIYTSHESMAGKPKFFHSFLLHSGMDIIVTWENSQPSRIGLTFSLLPVLLCRFCLLST